MTTIAFDGKTLAADRCTSAEPFRYRSMGKLCVLNVAAQRQIPHAGEWTMGFCGSVPHIIAAKRALVEGHSFPDPGQYDLEPSAEMAIAVRSRGMVYAISFSGEWMPVGTKVWAIGAGREIAMGAMYAGAGAERAIRIVARIAPQYASLGVQSVRVRR